MHCDIEYDDTIDQLLDMTTHTVATEPATTVDSPVRKATNVKRERLVVLAAGGHAKQYLVRDLTSEQMDTMADKSRETTLGVKGGLVRL